MQPSASLCANQRTSASLIPSSSLVTNGVDIFFGNYWGYIEGYSFSGASWAGALPGWPVNVSLVSSVVLANNLLLGTFNDPNKNTGRAFSIPVSGISMSWAYPSALSSNTYANSAVGQMNDLIFGTSAPL